MQQVVQKIIKANLPQELSRYFLFDAMEAGNLQKGELLIKNPDAIELGLGKKWKKIKVTLYNKEQTFYTLF